MMTRNGSPARLPGDGILPPWNFGKEDEPVKTILTPPPLLMIILSRLLNCQHMTGWLYACYQAGALTEKETGLPLSQIGTRDFLDKLLYKIANREGFGDILAEGMMRTREKVSEKARALSPAASLLSAIRMVCRRAHLSPMPCFTPSRPECIPSPCINGLFTHAVEHAPGRPQIVPVSPESFLKIAQLFWGSEAAADQTTYTGKAMRREISRTGPICVTASGFAIMPGR